MLFYHFGKKHGNLYAKRQRFAHRCRIAVPRLTKTVLNLILLHCFAMIIGLAVICSAPPACAIDLSANPYIKAAPYQPPPLPPLAPTPLFPEAQNGNKANTFQNYAPTLPHYRPQPSLDPSKAVNHEQWCRRNYPSYRPSDNTYRPFDKNRAMPPQARRPCVSPIPIK